MPYRAEGDSRPGTNCYRVLLGLYSVIGISLPDLGHVADGAWPLARKLDSFTGMFRYVDPALELARIGDVVLFELPGQPIHLAVIETKKGVVHAAEKIGLLRTSLRDLARTTNNLKVIRYVGPDADKLRL